MYFHAWLQPRDQNHALVADLILNLSFDELERRILVPYRNGQTLINRGKAITSDNIGHLRIYCTPKYLGRRQYDPYRLKDIAHEISDELITPPPGSESGQHLKSKDQPRPPANTRRVFVVHGRNEAARDAAYAFIRSIGLEPVEWSNAVSATGKATPYIGEILDTAFSRAHAVLVLFTPDDEARLRDPLQAKGDPLHETELTGQARPNVLFEAGMAMGRSPDRTILVEFGKLRPFTDIAGLHVIRMDDSTQRRQELAQRLVSAGCPVELDGTDWHKAGDFSAVIALSAQESTAADWNQQQALKLTEPTTLTPDAQKILLDASRDTSRSIVKVRTVAGLLVQTNDKDFADSGNARSEALWEQVIHELVEHGFIEDATGVDRVFRVTNSGFECADNLSS